MLGYLTDINGDENPITLKSGTRFLFFYDILKGYYNWFLNFKKKKKNGTEGFKKKLYPPNTSNFLT
jgi:hypothetical protein